MAREKQKKEGRYYWSIINYPETNKKKKTRLGLIWNNEAKNQKDEERIDLINTWLRKKAK